MSAPLSHRNDLGHLSVGGDRDRRDAPDRSVSEVSDGPNEVLAFMRMQ
jgi:hypothetical protein